MTVTSIGRDSGPNICIVRLAVLDSISSFTAAGWIATQQVSIIAVNNGEFEWRTGDAVLVQYPTGTLDSHGNPILSCVLMKISNDFNTLIPISILSDTHTGIASHAGGGQALATPLQIGVNIVTTVTTTADSVLLPSDSLGEQVIVVNRGAQSLAIYPAVGSAIDSLGNNNAYTLVSGGRVIFISTSVTRWNSLGLATS